MKLNIALVLVLVIGFANGCSENPTAPIDEHPDNPFIPLAVGNWWKYTDIEDLEFQPYYNAAFSSTGLKLPTEILSKEDIEVEYYSLNNHDRTWYLNSENSSGYTYIGNDLVYAEWGEDKSLTTHDIFAVIADDSVSVRQFGGYLWIRRESQTVPIPINNNAFYYCIVIEGQNMDDGDLKERYYIARGIGVIKLEKIYKDEVEQTLILADYQISD